MNDYHLLKNAYGGVKESYSVKESYNVRREPYCIKLSRNDPVTAHYCGTVGEYISLLPIRNAAGTLMHHLLSFEFTINNKKVDVVKINGDIDESNLCCFMPERNEVLNMLFKNFSNYKKEIINYKFTITSISPWYKETQEQINDRINKAAMYQTFADELSKLYPKIVKNNDKFECRYIIPTKVYIPDALRPSCLNRKNLTLQMVKDFYKKITAVKRSDNLTDFTFSNLEGSNGQIININYMRDGVTCVHEDIKFTLLSWVLREGKFRVSFDDFKKGTFEVISDNSVMLKNVPGVTIVV